MGAAMMIPLTNEQAQIALQHIQAELGGHKLPAATALDLRKNIEKLLEVVTPFEEARIALCKECAEKDAEGEPVIENGMWKIAADQEERRQSEYNDLAAQEHEVSIRPILVSRLDLAGIMLSASFLAAAGWMLKDDRPQVDDTPEPAPPAPQAPAAPTKIGAPKRFRRA